MLVRLLYDGRFTRYVSPEQILSFLVGFPPFVSMALVYDKQTLLPMAEVVEHGRCVQGRVLIEESHVTVVELRSDGKWWGFIDVLTCNAAGLDRAKALAFIERRLPFRVVTVHDLPISAAAPSLV